MFICWLLASEYICERGFRQYISCESGGPSVTENIGGGEILTYEERSPPRTLLTVLHFAPSAALHRRRATIACQPLKVSGNCVFFFPPRNYARWPTNGGGALVLPPHRFIFFSNDWDKRVIYISLGECSLSHPHPPSSLVLSPSLTKAYLTQG